MSLAEPLNSAMMPAAPLQVIFSGFSPSDANARSRFSICSAVSAMCRSRPFLTRASSASSSISSIALVSCASALYWSLSSCRNSSCIVLIAAMVVPPLRGSSEHGQD